MPTENQSFDNSFGVEDAAKAMHHTPQMKQSAYQAQNSSENLEVDASAVQDAANTMSHSSQQQEEVHSDLNTK